ncbi:DUF2256 domain-containing protein [Nisaea sp.]|uniref:DUF2256 domain-containing protein n=1 Tax=Nisaea sp. TaxID=2024842 RepID=UPI0026000BE4|nr:DUF2256 domain-containing protein [Nisaea sp.]
MKMKRKGDLPEKICVTCRRPFAWRRKWARAWDEVRYCSERCRRSAKTGHEESSARKDAALSR